MSNLGIGIGAFMGGVVQGASAMQGIKRSKQQERLYDMQAAKFEREESDAAALRTTSQQAVADAQGARGGAIDTAIQSGFNPGDGKSLPSWQVGGKTYTSEAEARSAAEGEVGSFYDFYMKTGAPKLVQGFLAAGQPEKAKAYQTWIQDSNVQRGVRSWAGAARAATMGDADGFMKHMVDAYNNNDYFNDNISVTGSRTLKDDKGTVTGMELTFKGPDGKESTQTFNGMEDIYRQGLQTMSPESALQYGLDQMKSADATRAKLAEEARVEGREVRKEERGVVREIEKENRTVAREDVTAARDQTYDLEKQSNASLLREAERAAAERLKITPDQARKRLAGISDKLTETDPVVGTVPGPDGKDTRQRYSELSPQEKVEYAAQQLEAEEGYVAERNATPATQGRRIPVWQP